jgi:hypothetical protein
MKAIKTLTSVFFIFGMFTLKSAWGQGMHQSHHDFNNGYWNGKETCKPCHVNEGTPSTQISTILLWNQQKSGIVFNLYSSSGLSGVPGGNSKLCLSCHDGIVGSEIHDDDNPDEGQNHKNMMVNHPVSVTYNDKLPGNRMRLNDPEIHETGLGGTIATDMLRNGKVECTSCHDIHVARNNEGCTGCHTLGNAGLSTKSLSLWKSNDYSALCLTCHNK